MIKNGWYYCDYCGKKLFPVLTDTKVIKLPLKCKNQLCPKREQIISIEQDI